MTYAWDNDSTQNAHIKQMRDDRQKAYMETHRDNKALKDSVYTRTTKCVTAHADTQILVYTVQAKPKNRR